MINSHLNLCQTSRNNNCFLFFLGFSADSDGYHTTTLCHPRIFIYMHWENQNHLQESPSSHISSWSLQNQLNQQPHRQLSQNCSSPSTAFQQPPQNRDSGSESWKGSGDPFCFPASSNGMLQPCLRSPNPSMRHPHFCTVPCLSIELIN